MNTLNCAFILIYINYNFNIKSMYFNWHILKRIILHSENWKN